MRLSNKRIKTNKTDFWTHLEHLAHKSPGERKNSSIVLNPDLTSAGQNVDKVLKDLQMQLLIKFKILLNFPLKQHMVLPFKEAVLNKAV